MTGDLSVLSFGRGKGWTGGAGGALLVRDAALDVSSAAAVGAESGGGGAVMLVKTLAQWALGRPSLYGLPSSLPWLGLGETRYKDPTVGRPMDHHAAALALGTRLASLAESAHRRSAAESLLQALDGAGLVPDPVRTVAVPPDAEPGYLRLPVLLAGGIDAFPSGRRARALGLAEAYPAPLTELVQLRPFQAEPARPCLGAMRLVRELVTLPGHSLVSPSDRQRIVGEMARYALHRMRTR
jgi:perosamine synthetase